MAIPDMADARRLMAELQQTAAELQREMHALGAASSALTSLTVEDEKRAVKLTVEANGAVTALQLDEDWRDTIGEEALEQAVTSCYQEALGRRAEQFLSSYAENADRDAAAAVVQPIVHPPVELGDPSAPSGLEAREQLRAMFDAADAEQSAFLADRSRRAREERDAINSSKSVMVTRQGDTITAIKLDDRWVRNTDDAIIEREIVQAMNNVMAMAARERENKFEGFPAIEKLMSIGRDPQEMMRRMGAIR